MGKSHFIYAAPEFPLVGIWLFDGLSRPGDRLCPAGLRVLLQGCPPDSLELWI